MYGSIYTPHYVHVHIYLHILHVMYTLQCSYNYIHCRSWRNNVRSKVSQPNQLDIYQTLCIMESELDEEEFKRMICSFVQHWEKKETVFIKYFQENYLNRCGKKNTISLFYVQIIEASHTYIHYSVLLQRYV